MGPVEEFGDEAREHDLVAQALLSDQQQVCALEGLARPPPPPGNVKVR